jgi:hypothetical protein
MSYRTSRDVNSSYNLFIEAYVTTTGFSSIFFKFNIDYLENYN